MPIRDLVGIHRPALIALATISIIAPGISRASDETPPTPHRDAARGRIHRDAIPGYPESPRGTDTYSGIMVGPLLAGFTEKFLADRDQYERRIQGTADLERMEQIYHEAIVSKLTPEYEISEVPGRDVLRADGLLIDHVLDKSDWLSPLGTTFRAAPDVQVVVFLRNSRTDELVDTVGVTLPRRTNRLMREGPGSYWHYMRLVFDRVATRVRWALEDQEPAP